MIFKVILLFVLFGQSNENLYVYFKINQIFSSFLGL